MAVNGGHPVFLIGLHAFDHALAPLPRGPLYGQIGGGNAFFQAGLSAHVPEIMVYRIHGWRRRDKLQLFQSNTKAHGPVLIPVRMALFDLDIADQPVLAFFVAGIPAWLGLGQIQPHVLGKVFHQRIEIQQGTAETGQAECPGPHFHKDRMLHHLIFQRYQVVPESLGPGAVIGEFEPFLIICGAHLSFSITTSYRSVGSESYHIQITH